MADGPHTATPSRRAPHAWDVARDAGGPVAHAFGALDADGRAWVWVEGEVVVIDPPRVGRRRAAGAPQAGTLSAPMPATVVSVHAGVGDAVRAGDTLVLLEAMKMELPLRAPRDGVVASITCVAGALVQPGVALVTLAEPDRDDA